MEQGCKPGASVLNPTNTKTAPRLRSTRPGQAYGQGLLAPSRKGMAAPGGKFKIAKRSYDQATGLGLPDADIFFSFAGTADVDRIERIGERRRR